MLVGVILKGQREGRFSYKQILYIAAFIKIQNPYEKLHLSSKALSKNISLLSNKVKYAGSLFPLYWGKVRFCFCLGTNHKVRHLPAVILTLFFKVRPHVKPSHP